MAAPRTISLDAMGGDEGPAVVVAGAAIALDRHPDVNFLLFGEGNIPWMVRELVRKTEKDPARRPRIIVG